MVIFRGYLYLFSFTEQTQSMVIKPVHILDDVTKVIFSEQNESSLALKMRDFRKQDSKFDHLIIEVKNRELLTDFLMEYAELNEDEIIFEMNEEFSILTNSTPSWFSFKDVEAMKKSAKQQDKAKQISGFLEMKQNKTIDYLKSLFGQGAVWQPRYCSIQGSKFFVYEG